jgi:hypothetical protein
VLDKLKVVRILDYVILTALGVLCFKYMSFYGRDFSETHVQFKFLDFPVFIGEFFLMTCTALLAVKLWLARIKIQPYHFLVIAYFGFVVFKALSGYVKWGPLALRDAALFYYVMFAVIAYYCYRPDYFSRVTILICYGLLFSMFFESNFNDFWLVGRLCLGLALALVYPRRWVGVLMAAGILLFTPYQYFMTAPRTIILGNFMAISFLIMTLAVTFTESKRRPLLAAGGLMVVLLFGLNIFYFSGNWSSRTIFQFSRLAAFFKIVEAEMQERQTGYKHREIKTQIYNPHTGAAVPSEAASSQQTAQGTSQPEAAPARDDEAFKESVKLGDSVFRLLIWRDLVREIAVYKPVLGFDFGKPFRSKSIEILNSATSEWLRDGWIAVHNSFLNIIYRAGLLGIVLIGMLVGCFVYMTKVFVRKRSVVGLLLCATILLWAVAANFAVILELPYTAIPFWTLYGVALAYAHQLPCHRKELE